jgi:hypothetical protein
MAGREGGDTASHSQQSSNVYYLKTIYSDTSIPHTITVVNLELTGTLPIPDEMDSELLQENSIQSFKDNIKG